jgi:hypothetical protein
MTRADASAPTWRNILDEPFVVAILGRRGSGKTALGHRLLEEYGLDATGVSPYVMGFPNSQARLLPDDMGILDVGIPYEMWPDDSVVLITEAHHIAHARRSMSVENLELDTLITLSRQKNTSIIFDTQYARRLDVSATMGANGIIFRYPSLMAEDFERSQMRSLVREAKESLDSYITESGDGDYTYREPSDELKRHAYIVSEKFRGEYPHEIRLPTYWGEKISSAFSDWMDDSQDSSSGSQNDVTVADERDSESEWESKSCPHLTLPENKMAYLSGIYRCSDCASGTQSPTQTPQFKP